MKMYTSQYNVTENLSYKMNFVDKINIVISLKKNPLQTQKERKPCQ